VSRTFGDIESKKVELDGIPGVVIASPEITSIPFNKDIDYVLLGCDGIFDVLTNEMVNEVIWETVEQYKQQKGKDVDNSNLLGHCLNDCVNNVLKKSLIQQSEDNVTVILVVFKDFLQ